MAEGVIALDTSGLNYDMHLRADLKTRDKQKLMKIKEITRISQYLSSVFC